MMDEIEFVLDTDAVSDLLYQGKRHDIIEKRLHQVPSRRIWITVVTVGELLRGALAQVRLTESREEGGMEAYVFLQELLTVIASFQILSYNNAVNSVFQSLSAKIKRVGTQDCKIAAIAIATNKIVVTRNFSHFQQIPDIRCEDWTTE